MAPQLRTEAGAKEVLLRLLQKSSARLRSIQLVAGHMAVSVSGRQSWAAHARITPTSDSVSLTEHFNALWATRTFASPLKVGIVFTELRPAVDETPSLFDEEFERHDLSAAIDDLNQKFGKNTVYLAGMSRAKNAAPERIAFDKVELFKEGKGDHDWPNPFQGPSQT
jgi:DNA polymerase-4